MKSAEQKIETHIQSHRSELLQNHAQQLQLQNREKELLMILATLEAVKPDPTPTPEETP